MIKKLIKNAKYLLGVYRFKRTFRKYKKPLATSLAELNK